MSTKGILICVLLSIALFCFLTVLTLKVTGNREDDTPEWEVLLLCIFFTPILAMLFEILKPYKPWYNKKNKE